MIEEIKPQFPLVEEYEVPEKTERLRKEFRRDFAMAVDYYWGNELLKLEGYAKSFSGTKYARAEVEKDLGALRGMDMKTTLLRFNDLIKTGQFLEVVALLDIVVSESEQELGIVSLRRDIGHAERKRQEERLKKVREKFSYYRDRLLEKIPALREEYTKGDLEMWLSLKLESTRAFIDGARDASALQDILPRIKGQYRVLECVLSGIALSGDEIQNLSGVIDDAMLENRALVEETLTGFLIGKPYDKYAQEELLKAEKDIMRLRQFKVGVESGEWVQINRNR